MLGLEFCDRAGTILLSTTGRSGREWIGASEADGGVSLSELKHNEIDMLKESNWAALPDLILILFPTGLLMISGSNDGKSRSQDALTRVEKLYVAALLASVTLFSSYERFRLSRARILIIIGSLVYSSVFPFTVSMGESRGYSMVSQYMVFSFILACMTMCISCFNPTLFSMVQVTTFSTLINARWYLPTLLYITTFQAISVTAYTSFNFEEVSLISHAVTHILLYVVESDSPLSAHEIFLPALTLGMMTAITPATPILQRIKTSSNPMKLAICSYAMVIFSILTGVRPWLVLELGEDPVIWVLKYMTSSEGYELRLAIVLWWLAVLAFGIIVPVKFFTTGSDQQDNGESLNKRRKFFHGIVVLLFLPALNLDVSRLIPQF